MRKIIFASCIILAALSCAAQLRLPVLFDDHMVIQREASVPIWGWANPLQEVRINVSWDTTTIKTIAENTTFWRTVVKTPVAGGPAYNNN